ncbi:MAG: hypothetical protein L6Q76_21265 [Polyangiaceae bacterium]|nr:hypothetical protein [Polyangiaceae bacterium]
MPSFVVDPILCTTPAEGASENDIGRFLLALDAWLRALEQSPFSWKHLHACSLALLSEQRFPTFEILRRAPRAAKTDINIAGLHQQLTRFFQNEEHDLYNVIHTQCAVVAESSPSISPESLVSRQVPEVQGPFVDGLLCLACDKAAEESFAKEAHLVTLPLAVGEQSASVRGTVALVEPEQQKSRLGSEVLDQSFPVLGSPGDLLVFQHEELLAGGEAGFLGLIEKLSQAIFSDAEKRLPLALGSQLWSSIEKSAILQDASAAKKLLHVCAALIAGREDDRNVGRRAVRETRAADSPQRTRKSDGAVAYRLTLTKHGAGFRLQYWHVLKGPAQEERIELANVVHETDPVSIPER